MENHVAVHVQHISRRCVRQGTKPLMHINMTQLVNEKEEFKAVLERLRQAKHRIELDDFIKECNRKAKADRIERA